MCTSVSVLAAINVPFKAAAALGALGPSRAILVQDESQANCNIFQRSIPYTHKQFIIAHREHASLGETTQTLPVQSQSRLGTERTPLYTDKQP